MSRLRRLATLLLHFRYVLQAAGGWRALKGQVQRDFASGWRSAYGTLLGLLSVGGRRWDRRYRRWIFDVERGDVAEQAPVGLVVSFAALDDTQADLLISKLLDVRRVREVLVDADSPEGRRALTSLEGTAVNVRSVTGDALAGAEDCIGLVFLNGASWVNERHLAAVARALDAGADVVYGDSDELDASGRRCRPRFKPGFSMDHFYYDDFVSECVAVSQALLARAPRWDFADPHGTLLQWCRLAQRVEHLPIILSHRFSPRAASCDEPPLILGDILRRQHGARARVEKARGGWRCRFPPVADVAVVIPTRDRLDLLAPCVETLVETNRDLPRFEILIVDNRSQQSQTLDWLARAERQDLLRIVRADCAFNWCRLNNMAIAASSADVFVFLNNDTLSTDANWLARLAEYAGRGDVGVAGARLTYADGTIQHAGIVLGHGDCADHIYRGTSPSFHDHAFVSPLLPREVCAVTGACMAVSRRTFQAIGPFDERYPIAGDIEYCLRCRADGLRNVYAADVALCHHESASRNRANAGADFENISRMVAERVPTDPFYNGNLTQVAGVGRGGAAFALLHSLTPMPTARGQTS